MPLNIIFLSTYVTPTSTFAVTVRTTSATQSVFLLAIIASALVGSLMLAVMYVAVKGVVQSEQWQRRHQQHQFQRQLHHNETASCSISSWLHSRNVQHNVQIINDIENDDYGTFGRRFEVFGHFTGSMASLQDSTAPSIPITADNTDIINNPSYAYAPPSSSDSDSSSSSASTARHSTCNHDSCQLPLRNSIISSSSQSTPPAPAPPPPPPSPPPPILNTVAAALRTEQEQESDRIFWESNYLG